MDYWTAFLQFIMSYFRDFCVIYENHKKIWPWNFGATLIISCTHLHTTEFATFMACMLNGHRPWIATGNDINAANTHTHTHTHGGIGVFVVEVERNYQVINQFTENFILVASG